LVSGTAPVRTKDRFLIFGQPPIEQAEIDEVVASMRAAWLGTGPKVARFEQDFLKYRRYPGHAVALYSCTAALHLAILALGLEEGDEVITTPMTFCATVNAILHAGAKPVLADVDRRKVTKRTKAVLPVHFAGRPCDMDAIMAICREQRLELIEDCAHAIETEYKGKPAGTFGRFGCFSFYATKNVAAGEGGLVLAQNKEDADRIKILGLHGMSRDAWKRFSDEGYKHYQVVECGFKYNMMDLQAAIAIHQLQRVEQYSVRRAQIWERYNREFEGLPIGLPAPIEANTRHALHLYTLMIDKARCGISRDEFLSAMTAQGIGVGVHYLSVTDHPYYQQTLGWKPEDAPHSHRIGLETVSIPITARLTDDDVGDVIKAVKRVLGK
jgi:dTDP-4-amino-4,6-dideoxygalactose transaminase